mmetsp:Transcript_174072/g.558102  ORF Transcript_174072/g.558102 Transcript_174072/m.558102 type:complete len:237 (-) Transcript_174072:293-1003(-)
MGLHGDVGGTPAVFPQLGRNVIQPYRVALPVPVGGEAVEDINHRPGPGANEDGAVVPDGELDVCDSEVDAPELHIHVVLLELHNSEAALVNASLADRVFLDDFEQFGHALLDRFVSGGLPRLEVPRVLVSRPHPFGIRREATLLRVSARPQLRFLGHLSLAVHLPRLQAQITGHYASVRLALVLLDLRGLIQKPRVRRCVGAGGEEGTQCGAGARGRRQQGRQWRPEPRCPSRKGG